MNKEFEKSGFVIYRNWFTPSLLNAFEDAAYRLYVMQAMKLRDYTALAYPSEVGEPVMTQFERLSHTCENMEGKNKEALYQVQKLLPSSPVLRGIANRCQSFLPELLDTDPALTLIDGPGVFVNRPNTHRLLYKWHSEEHYYPKRRTFVNVWFPLFGKKTAENGTMSVKVGSHKEYFPFSEYQEADNHFIQYAIPDDFVNKFETFHCEVNRGDVVVFHSNLVHRSNENRSQQYSFAGVVRVWDPSNDLTLAGNLAVTPYGKDMGKMEVVIPPGCRVTGPSKNL